MESQAGEEGYCRRLGYATLTVSGKPAGSNRDWEGYSRPRRPGADATSPRPCTRNLIGATRECGAATLSHATGAQS